MISWRVRPLRDDLLGCPGLGIPTWGHRGLPKCRRHPSGVWCGGKISTRRRARGCCRSCTGVQTGQAAPKQLLLTVRHACIQGVWGTQAVNVHAPVWAGGPILTSGRQGERLSEGLASRLAAHCLSWGPCMLQPEILPQCGLLLGSLYVTTRGPSSVWTPTGVLVCYNQRSFLSVDSHWGPCMLQPEVLPQCGLPLGFLYVTTRGPSSVWTPTGVLVCYNQRSFLSVDSYWGPCMLQPEVLPQCGLLLGSLYVTTRGPSSVWTPTGVPVCSYYLSSKHR